VILHRIKIRDFERGLLFRDRQFREVLGPGTHWRAGLRLRVDRASLRQPLLVHPDLDLIARSGRLSGHAEVLDLAGHERALVFVDGRPEAVLRAGLHAVWTGFQKVAIERVDARGVRFEHDRLALILAAPGAREALDSVLVEPTHAGLLFVDGRLTATLLPGTHAWWKGLGRVRAELVDLREQAVDLAGQEIMTADKVTLRLNAVMSFRVADPVRSLNVSDDARQALYREAQLALRAAVGTRELDLLLSDKDGLARSLHAELLARAASLGLELVSLGVRDVILPGDMKELLNRVTEAKKAAEAQLITRREETAAMRSQANTARLFESNPTLMRLRELETLEKVAAAGKLSIVLSDKGLTDKLVNAL